MRRAFFITGAGTGVGKTFVAAGLAAAMRRMGIDVGVMKPVETGCASVSGRLIPADALTLKEASGADDPIGLINPYRFRKPLAPSIASRLSGARIEFRKIRESFRELSDRHDLMLVEGAGGILSPVAGRKTTADLASFLETPVIIVAPSGLGAINQALLAAEAARNRRLRVIGIVLNSVESGRRDDLSRRYNSTEIQRLTGSPVFEVPFMKREGEKKKRGPFSEGAAFVLLLKGLLLPALGLRVVQGPSGKYRLDLSRRKPVL